VLERLDQAHSSGHSIRTGGLVAQALDDVSKHQAWRTLRSTGVSLERRRGWCISTDPAFARKTADVIRLDLHSPQNALALAIGERPSIQALERAQGWIRLPNGKALPGSATATPGMERRPQIARRPSKRPLAESDSTPEN